MSETAAERRLVAILAADVVGYSRMMEADERDTLERVKDLRRNLIEPKVAEHHGRIFKTNGDGFLVEFTSAVDAVGCAVEIQRQMVARNLDLTADRRMDLRIGINVGDVYRDGDDLFGDGVNIAARLEGLAKPGGICVSRGVHDPVRERLDFEFVDQGEQQVKNIKRPIQVFTVRYDGMPTDFPSPTSAPKTRGRSVRLKIGFLAGLPIVALATVIAIWLWPSTRSKTASDSSLIVLPFQNSTNQPGLDARVDTLTEAVIDLFANDSDYTVLPVGTSFIYKGKSVEERQVAHERNVRYVISGSLALSGDGLAVKARIYDASAEKILSSRSVDRPLQATVETLREDAINLAESFQDQISDVELAEVARLPLDERDPRSLIAHADAIYQKSESYGDLERAIGLADKALSLNANFEDAMVDGFFYRSELYWLGGYANAAARLEARTTIQRLIARALELAPERKGTQIWAVLALLDIGEDDGIEGRIRLLLRDNADSPDLHGYLAMALLRRDRVDEARHEALLSMRLGAETSSGPWALGNVELQANDWTAAVDAFRLELAANPGDPTAWLLLSAALQLAGQTDEAQKSAAQLMVMCPSLATATLRDMANDPYGTQKPGTGYVAARARMIDALEAAGVPSTLSAR